MKEQPRVVKASLKILNEVRRMILQVIRLIIQVKGKTRRGRKIYKSINGQN